MFIYSWYNKEQIILFSDIINGTDIGERRSSYSPAKSLLSSTGGGAAAEVSFYRIYISYREFMGIINLNIV